MTSPTAPFHATLPLPPSVNDAVRPARVRLRVAGRVKEVLRLVKTREAKVFEKQCRALVAGLHRHPGLKRGPLELYLTVYVASISSDGGNRLKLLEDALKGLVMADDRQLVEWHILKRIDAERPRVELVVKPADPAEHAEVAARLARAEARPPGAPRPRGGRDPGRHPEPRPPFRIQPTPAVHRPRAGR